jgi:hypothetical protein
LAEAVLLAGDLEWTIAHLVNLKDASSGASASVQPLDQVGRVPGVPTLPFLDAAKALVAIADGAGTVRRRVLVTTERGWRPATA